MRHVFTLLPLALAACLSTTTTGNGSSSSSSSSSSGASSSASFAGSSSSAIGTSSSSQEQSSSTSSMMVTTDGGTISVDGGPVSSATEDVYTRLRPTCIACHSAGANYPFFDSLSAFSTLLVGDTRFVVPGQPDESGLIRLLTGTNMGTWRQMPLGPRSFAQLEADGETQITVEEVRTWIEGLLPPMMMPPVPDPSATTVRRMTVEQIVASLYQELGIDEAYDIRHDPTDRGSQYQSFDVRSRHEPLRQWSDGPYDRFEKLGGPNWFNGRRRTQEITPAFTQYFTQLAQTWCYIAVTKEGSVLFPRVARDAPSSTSAADIRANIAAMHLRLLGEPATNEELDELFTIFTSMEGGQEGPRRAWMGVCSAILRDPRWILY